MNRPQGGLIVSVLPGSLGHRLDLQSGDRLVAINGNPVRDIIDVQFYGAEEELELLVERQGRRQSITAVRGYGDELGLAFAHPTFDVDVRRCSNNCDFCFVKHNPRGMRRSLYVKDDDYRYSFLHGSFVTLTNLREEDWQRLEEQRLSPLYVSVHATEPELRRRFLHRAEAPDILDQLRRLAKLGIEVHTQVVLVPGLNDGGHLARTCVDLAELHTSPVASVSIVPVGLTKFHAGGCRTYTPEEAGALLDQVEPWRSNYRVRLGRTFVYPADEWYLVAGRDVPAAGEYDGFPQVENGVGLVRGLLDDWAGCKPDPGELRLRPATLACGTLIAPVLARIVGELGALVDAHLHLIPVTNGFFGAVTTVSGLLTGQDVVESLQGQVLGDVVLLPKAMFGGVYGAGSSPRNTTLDDLTVNDIAHRLGVRIETVDTLREVLAILSR